MARLILATAQGTQSVELGPKNTLGRHPKSTILVLDKIVAKEHCVIEKRGGEWVLKDLGSLNGTYVNADRVKGEKALRHGDEIALGATRARFDDGSSPLEPRAMPISPGISWQARPPSANKPN